MITKSKLLLVALVGAAVFPILGVVVAQANVYECEANAVRGSSQYDGRRVQIYLRNSMGGATHYNFKTNPGAQIELGGNEAFYSFEHPQQGERGTYSAQACRRGGFGSSSFCTRWATFTWNSRTDWGNRPCHAGTR
jgi:hypothetical protein